MFLKFAFCKRVSLFPRSCFGPAAMKSCHRTVERKLPRKQVVAQRMIWLLPKGRLLQESKCRPNVDPRQKSNERTGGQCNVRNKCLEFHHRALLLCNLGNVFLPRLKMYFSLVLNRVAKFASRLRAQCLQIFKNARLQGQIYFGQTSFVAPWLKSVKAIITGSEPL